MATGEQGQVMGKNRKERERRQELQAKYLPAHEAPCGFLRWLRRAGRRWGSSAEKHTAINSSRYGERALTQHGKNARQTGLASETFMHTGPAVLGIIRAGASGIQHMDDEGSEIRRGRQAAGKASSGRGWIQMWQAGYRPDFGVRRPRRLAP